MNTDFEILTKLIKDRRSIFPATYIEKEIPAKLIANILESANYAPTHKLTQPWRFVVIRKDAKTRLGQMLADLYKVKAGDRFLQKKYDSFFQKTSRADCIIAVNIQFHPDKLPEWEEIAATACAVQNMALTAHSLSIGTYWSSPPLINSLGDFLGLADRESCFGLFYMGYHDTPEGTANRTPMADKVKWMEV
ncbi:putative NAD(P)H nitroreductase YdjA [compost metagenome]